MENKQSEKSNSGTQLPVSQTFMVDYTVTQPCIY
uniref:Uncharacterized protein n=1 Tax=Anguilla anguilla TaxID=7936 RepID=A0A0E9WJR7_ANGAN